TGGDYRVFTVLIASEVTFSKLTITGGRPFGVSVGGAIANAGNTTVNVIDCDLNANYTGVDGGSGGAIANGPGSINIINSRITDNLAAVPVVDNESGGGGGIANHSTGTVNITNSYILQNHVTGGRKFSAVMGGGIYNASTGTVNVTNSWIGNNDVKMTTAADSYGGGGGIGNADAGPVNVTDSVISANFISGGDATKAPGIRGVGILNATTGAITVTSGVSSDTLVSGGRGGGISNTSGTLSVTNSTFTKNRGIGGALFGQGTVQSSIIAKNNLNPFAGSDVSGNFTSAGFNLIGVEEGSAGFTAPTDMKGTVAAPLDPKLDPNDNSVNILGFPVAIPGQPLCGSPLIDKGMSSGQTTDLRGAGYARTIDDPNQANAGDGTDIGVLER